MRKIVRNCLPPAALILLILFTMGSANAQSFPKPTGVTAAPTPEGHVVVSWHRDPAPVHRVGWAHNGEFRVANAAGDWLEAFHFADTKRPTDYTVKYLPAEQAYWFIVGAARERFAGATWSDWAQLITPSSGQPVTGPQPVTPVQPQGNLVSNKLIAVLAPRSSESMLDCEASSSGVANYRMSVEFLVDANRHTGEYEPMLATEWSLSPDGRAWNFKLRQGVRWHDNWGQFTAHDVAHSMDYYTSPDCRASYSGYFRSDPGANVQVVNDYEVNVRTQTRPAVDLIYWISGHRGLPISSKAQWDQRCPGGAADYVGGYCAASRDLVYAKSARTGPYEFGSFDEDRSVWEWRRVDYDHWRIDPDFAEIVIYSVREERTRHALIAAQEAHIVQSGRQLLQDASDGGLEIVDSSIPVNNAFAFFGGLYYASDIAANRDEQMPWNIPGENGRKVRMAMNKAIDREALNAAIFQNSGSQQWVAALIPDFPVGYEAGLRPGWESRWEELYGYDPERARQLLAEAGYPDGFAFRIPVFTLTGVPELTDMMEAMAAYWQRVGLVPSVAPTRVSDWRFEYHGLNTECCVYPYGGPAAPIDILVHFYFSAERFHRAYTSDNIQLWRDRALQARNHASAAANWQGIADELYYQSATIPGWTLPAHAVVHPRVVSDYTFLGPNNGTYIYLEYAQGVRR